MNLREGLTLDSPWKVFSAIILVISGCIFLCSVLYLGEWYVRSSQYRQWVSENEFRVNFAQYKTAEEVRQGLLAKFPPGTSLETIKKFYFENAVQDGGDVPDPDTLEYNSEGWAMWVGGWRPVGGGYCPDTVSDCIQLRLHVNRCGNDGQDAYGGHFLQCFWPRQWFIFIHLDPETRELIDFRVRLWTSHF